MLHRQRTLKRRSGGQVLVVVVMVLLILLVVTFFLFDLQGVIRLRARSQNAADAAALTAAAWQGRTLNMIGELNLLKAATVMLTGVDPGPLNNPGDPEAALLEPVALLTEMQTRLTYVGPLMGLAAAQQAAKHNGLRNVTAFTDALQDHVNTYLRDSGGNLYRSIYGDDPDGLGYNWTGPYQAMLETIVAEGIAANPVNSRFLAGTPALEGLGGDLLLDPSFYRAIYGRDFCWFYRRGIGVDHEPIDLSGIRYRRQPEGYFPGSEFLPLYVTFASGPPPDDALAGFLAERNLEALPENQSGLAKIRWAVYESTGDGYGWDCTENYRFMNPYLRSDFRTEYTYGGACARMMTTAKPEVLTGRWSWKYGHPEAEESTRQLGQEMGWSGAEFGPGRSFSSEAARLRAAESRMSQLRAHNAVESVASAKPFGELNGEVPQAAGIVLPVFTDVRLIPVGLAHSNPVSADAEFYQFIIEFFGNSDYPDVPADVQDRFSYYLDAIAMYNDPNSDFSAAWRDFDTWRNAQMAGLDGIPNTADDQRDPCEPVFGGGGGGGGGGGSTGGPDIIH